MSPFSTVHVRHLRGLCTQRGQYMSCVKCVYARVYIHIKKHKSFVLRLPCATFAPQKHVTPRRGALFKGDMGYGD